MKLHHFCLFLVALLACAAAQSEDDIPVENDNQFPPDNNSETEDALNELEEIVDDIATQSSEQAADDDALSSLEAVNLTSEAPSTDITTETTIPPVEDTQSTTQEDAPLSTQEEDLTTQEEDAQLTTQEEDSTTQEEDAQLTTPEDDAQSTTKEEDTELTSQDDFAAAEDQIASNSTESSIDAVDVLADTEIGISAESDNEDVTTKSSSPSIEDVPSPQLDMQESTELAFSAEPVNAVSTEPTVTEEVRMTTSELDFAISAIDALAEQIDVDTRELSVVDDQNEEEPIDAVTTDSSSLGEDMTFSTNANDTDVDSSDDSAIGVEKFSVLLPGDIDLPTTEVDGNETDEVTNTVGYTSTESVLDFTNEPSTLLAVDEESRSDYDKESTGLVSSMETVDVSTTEAIINLDLDAESPTTLEGSVIAENTLQATEESHNEEATVTSSSPIDPSEFSIRSNKADLDAISPLTLAEAPKEVATPQEVEIPKDMEADNKEDVSVGATTSVNKAGGVDKSVIGLIVAGMVVVVAGITVKKNWKSIKNKFSSSPRAANGSTNHTNGIAPEEVPLQDKDNKNPSPV